MRKQLLFLVLFLLSISVFVVSCNEKETTKTAAVSVMLTEGEGYKIKGDNPQKVRIGGNAEFIVELDKDYKLDKILPENTEYEYRKNSLVIKNIKFPQTYEFLAVNKKKKHNFFLNNHAASGEAVCNVESGKVYDGTRIELRAVPHDDYEFTGWSLDKKLTSGGELLSSERDFSFIIKERTSIYANYVKTSPEKEEPQSASRPSGVVVEAKLIRYYPNGGTIVDSDAEFFTAESYDNYYLMPNTLPGANEIFIRDGYKLIGFSDTADGSGNFYGIGHTARFAEDESSDTMLYCVWQKYSDLSLFEYEEKSDEVTILKYNGNEETVVVPERIDGKKVTRIASGAISGDNIKTIMLPYALRIGESGAIYDCPLLQKVHMSDAIKDVPNDFFAGTAKFRTLHLDAAIAPAFSGYYRNFAVKYQYLMSLPDDRPKLVVISGSNTDHGVNTLTMEESLGNKYYCINYGTDAAFNITLYLDCVSNMLSKGDYIIHNFEQMDYCRGTFEINSMTFQGLESTYNILSLVDFSKYSNFFEALCTFNESRGNMIGGNYTTNPAVHNKRGEKLSIQQNYNREDFVSGSNGTFRFSDEVISSQEAENLSMLYNDIRSRGVNILISYPSFNFNGIEEPYRNSAAYAEYDSFIRKNIDAPLISKVEDYIFKGIYMSNTDYHLNEHGRRIRTEYLIRDFCKYTGDKYTPSDISADLAGK